MSIRWRASIRVLRLCVYAIRSEIDYVDALIASMPATRLALNSTQATRCSHKQRFQEAITVSIPYTPSKLRANNAAPKARTVNASGLVYIQAKLGILLCNNGISLEYLVRDSYIASSCAKEIRLNVVKVTSYAPSHRHTFKRVP